MKQEPRLAKTSFEIKKEQEPSKRKLRLVDEQYLQDLEAYKKFDQIDGTHDWQKQVPEGYIAYQARVVRSAKVSYFNFDLAKEMGLLDKSHPHQLTEALHEKIVDCFGLRIINEYDIQHKKTFSEHDIKPNLYMATRYLQLQHPNKQGKTSGDGRSIWNGQFQASKKSTVWDVSSRGTGVTALSPGAVEAKRFLQTGQDDFGYGCGLAEVDELYGTAIMSEIFHQNGIPTERTLAILETGPGVGIGVRAAPNLIRPAHMFSFLKQGNYDALKRATDFFIDRQYQNRRISFHSKHRTCYQKLLKKIVAQYAEFSARLESDYIFAWFDWDGDNMLMDVGILDYGSIRQFGLRHDEYRYDDVSRFSTNLNEQRKKTRQIVQVFCQMIDFLETKKKKSFGYFAHSKELVEFDNVFYRESYLLFLKKLGFSEKQTKQIYKKYSLRVKNLFQDFSAIEKLKASNKLESVDDGVNKPPLYNPRTLLRYATYWLEGKSFDAKETHKFCVAESCKYSHVDVKSKHASLFHSFFKNYTKLMELVKSSQGLRLKSLKEKCLKENHPDRITGNSITFVVDEILETYKSTKNKDGIQAFIDLFIHNQLKKTQPHLPTPSHAKVPKDLMREVLHIVKTYNEDI